MLLPPLEDSLLTQSSQVQAAEDILDKYRNIKRTSPSNGATGGTSYDGTGGKALYVWRLNMLCYTDSLIWPHCYVIRPLWWGWGAWLHAEHFHRWPSRLCQPDSPAAWLKVLFQVSIQMVLQSFSCFSATSFYVVLFVVVFSDAKKKLRLALCSADSVALPIMTPASTRNGLPDHMESEGGPGLV